MLPQLVLGIASQGKDRGYAYPKISTVSDVLCHTLHEDISEPSDNIDHGIDSEQYMN